VDEIQKIRTKLKSSKSYPNDFLRQQQQLLQNRHPGDINEEGDNSSSGVSSDQEIPPVINHNNSINNINNNNNANNKQIQINNTNHNTTNNGEIIKPTTLDITQKSLTLKKVTLVTTANSTNSESLEKRSDDEDDTPSPPAKGFQRHNSLTRKQAMSLAASRAKTVPATIQSRHAVTLAKLPPPMETHDESDHTYLPPPLNYSARTATMNALKCSTAIPPPVISENVVLAPPPEFCDIVETTNARVRIVGAVPKPKTKTCNHHHRLQSQNL
jgi:hypothetical protein